MNSLYNNEDLIIDVDECKEDPSPCGTACTNLPGSYRCDCDEGFESNGNGTCTG